MKKRHELPPFKKLDMRFNVDRLIEDIRNMPTQQDDLKEKGCYGVEVGGKAPKLQKAFGLKFDSIEDAYKFLQDNDVEESELRKGLGNKRMAWDYRNYVKPFDNYIVKGDDDKYHVSGSPYKQIALTEYNAEMENRVYEKKIPKSSWMRGTTTR